MPRSLAPLYLLPCVLLTCACGADAVSFPAAPAQPPLAHLSLPRLGDPSVALLFDAGLSQSPGGTLSHYRFSFGDGSALADSGAPRVRHTYASEGVFDVQLEVEDLLGRTARVVGILTVRKNAPACSRDEDCDTPDVCRESLCVTTMTKSPPAGSDPD